MKLQILYAFLLAAPLLVHLLSHEPPAAPEPPAAHEPTAVKEAPAVAPATSEPSPENKKPRNTPDARSRAIPPAHAFTFM